MSALLSMGLPLPPSQHTILASLPTWHDIAEYSTGQAAIRDAMKTGHPRFFVHRSVQKVCDTRSQAR